MMKFFVCLLVFVGVVLSARITDNLLSELSLKNGKADVLIHMREQVDFSKVSHKGINVYDIRDHDLRGELVVQVLMKNAMLTQPAIISILKKHKIHYQQFWVSNTIVAYEVPQHIVTVLSDRTDIDFLEVNKAFELDIEQPTGVVAPSSQEPEWNLVWVGADKVWNEFNVTGRGITIGSSDTGVQYNHPALLPSYRGNQGGRVSHDYNWFDATPNKVKVPEDDNGHGTHVVGTHSGGKDRQIGGAPGSSWIHCRSMKITTRQWSPATFIGCLQFFLAPTDVEGRNPQPAKRPFSTSHSYGCGANLGCPDPMSMRPASVALAAAGVFMFVSSGNAGPRCQTVLTQPAIYHEQWTVGATGFKTDTIASFSSRGPVDNRLKPNVVAPGSNVVSAAPGNRYTALSGTSMASPLVNGAIGLLWEAVPSLQRQLNKTMDIIQKAAKKIETTDCSSPQRTPNNVYGHGIINIYEAIKEAKRIYGK